MCDPCQDGGPPEPHPDWISIYTRLEQEPDKFRVVQFIKLLCALNGAVEECLLLGECKDLDIVKLCPSDWPTEIQHEPFTFLRRGTNWSALEESISGIPFLKKTADCYRWEGIFGRGPTQQGFRLEPGFHKWLEGRLRDSGEKAYWVVTALLVLHRFTPSPLTSHVFSDDQGIYGAAEHASISRRPISHHVLKNFVEICQTGQSRDILFLPPELRLPCLLYYINWNGWASHHKHSVYEVFACDKGFTHLVLETFADCYRRDSLVAAIIKAEEFLQARYADDTNEIFNYPPKFVSIDVWLKHAEELADAVEALEIGATLISPPDSFAVDTLVAIVLTLVSKSIFDDVRCEPTGVPDDHYVEACLLRGRIVEATYNFCNHLPGDHTQSRIVLLAQCLYKIYEGKNALLQHFPKAILLLPPTLCLVYFRNVLEIHASCNNWEAYASTLLKVLRIRPDVILPSGRLRDRAVLLQYMGLETLNIAEMIPMLDAESIAAHNLLFTGGRFIHHSERQDMELIAWNPVIRAFFLLAKLYFNANEFRAAAVLSNTYIVLARLTWAQMAPAYSGGIEHAFRNSYFSCYRSEGRYIHHWEVNEGIRILLISLRSLGLLSLPLDSCLLEHVDGVLRSLRDQKVLAPDRDTMLELMESFWLINYDKALKDARRRLVRMGDIRKEVVETMLKAEERLGLPEEYATSSDSLDTNLYILLLTHLEYPEEFSNLVKLLENYRVAPGRYINGRPMRQWRSGSPGPIGYARGRTVVYRERGHDYYYSPD